MFNDQNRPAPDQPLGHKAGNDILTERATAVPVDTYANGLDILYGILFQPVQTLRYVGQTRPIGLAFLVVLGVQLFTWSVNTSLGAQTAWPGRVPPGLPPHLSTYFPEMLHRLTVAGGLIWLVMTLFFWFFVAAVFNLLAEFLGGQSNGRGMFAAVGLAGLPGILVPPLRLLKHLGFPSWLFIFLTVAVSLWIIALYILAIREVNGLSTARAVVVFVTPLAALLGLVILIVITMAVLMLPFLPGGI
ncbi:MAG: hypothetical protein HPY81_04530 [Firmicutes bacterium]|nr:hypothetical protein [Bacillota bacterium]